MRSAIRTSSRTPLQPTQRFKKEEFEMGFILQSKGDTELVYIARKKFLQHQLLVRDSVETGSNLLSPSQTIMSSTKNTNSTVVTTIREVTKKRLVDRQVA